MSVYGNGINDYRKRIGLQMNFLYNIFSRAGKINKFGSGNRTLRLEFTRKTPFYFIYFFWPFQKMEAKVKGIYDSKEK